MVTTVVRNDTSFDLNFTAKDANGTALDLTDISQIRFKMALPRATTCKINQACTVLVAASGTCKYTAQLGDFDTIGLYQAELQLTYTDTKVMTAKLDDIHVIEDLPTT